VESRDSVLVRSTRPECREPNIHEPQGKRAACDSISPVLWRRKVSAFLVFTLMVHGWGGGGVRTKSFQGVKTKQLETLM
jgi:hypothetical protein